jgi:transcriptional regulator with XRE-family HTH domain
MLDSIRSQKVLESIGKKLKRARKGKKLALRKVAELASVAHTQVDDLERGKLNATILTILAIAEVLEVDLNDLFNYRADLD